MKRLKNIVEDRNEYHPYTCNKPPKKTPKPRVKIGLILWTLFIVLILAEIYWRNQNG